MKTSTKTAWVLGPPLVFPVEVLRLARQHTEGPFGNAPAILFMTAMGGALALVYVGVALWKWRTRKRPPIPWLLAAGIAISPAACYFLWNVFIREA